MAILKVLGINDEVTTCECCGRAGLKKTVILSDGEGEKRFGVDCAATALMGSKKSGDKRIVTVRATAAELARKWLSSGHLPAVVARGIWNRFGFQTSAVADGVDINTVGIITLLSNTNGK